MRTEGHAVESICRVLREQGCQIAARTYRQWAGATRPVATRTITDAIVTDRVRDLVWTVDHAGVRRMTPEGLYGRRKMTALVKRADADTSPGSVDRAMRTLGLQGVRRAKGVRTTIPAKDGKRAGDLLDRDFPPSTSCREVPPPPKRPTAPGSWTSRMSARGPGSCMSRSSWMSSPRRSSRTPSTTAPARSSGGRPPPRSSTSNYAPFNNPVLHRQVELAQYTSLRPTENLALEEIRPSIGSVGDAYDNALMETINGLY